MESSHRKQVKSLEKNINELEREVSGLQVRERGRERERIVNADIKLQIFFQVDSATDAFHFSYHWRPSERGRQKKIFWNVIRL